jgi:tetratricopeptide (TPR) repeat protein
MPKELYEGMIQFELDRGNYFKALILMDESYQNTHYVDHVAALKGFNINSDVDKMLKKIYAQEKSKEVIFTSKDFFQIGRLEYQLGRCKPALRAFKKLKNKLSQEQRQERIFYRANCFIRLGSNVKAMQVLNNMVDGVWASHAYYNLGVSYDELSRDKSKALKAFKLAKLLNKGKTLQEKELNNQINLSVGSLYLNHENPDLSSKFFKKVYLDSAIAPQALYLNGLAKLELNDFRAATQSWFSVKKYPLVNQSVAEALLAIPYAYERSGYISQTLEAYIVASDAFKAELKVISKIDGSLMKYGAAKIFIEDNNIEGLEWFLAKDVVTNTMKATYYNYFMGNFEIYDAVELYSELKMLSESMEFWSSQLTVFSRSLKEKQSTFSTKSKSFSLSKTQKKIDEISNRISQIQVKNNLTQRQIDRLQIIEISSKASKLSERLNELNDKVANGRGQLKTQLQMNTDLNIRRKTSQKQLKVMIKKLDVQITRLIREQLGVFKIQMLSNFERSEQGLVHVFQDIAESSDKQKNRLDGRYK